MTEVTEKILINAGCGLNVIKGYKNIDNFYTEEEIRSNKESNFEEGAEYEVMDILHMTYPDNYADGLELQQVIEHFSAEETIPLLTEIFRVLKPGGYLNIGCPSFNGLCSNWIATELRNRENFDYNKFFFLNQEFYGIQTQAGEFHKCAMTPDYVAHCLGRAGFTATSCSVFLAGSRMPEDGYGLMKPIHLPGDDRAYFRMETLFFHVVKPEPVQSLSINAVDETVIGEKIS